MKFITKSENETRNLAEKLGQKLCGGEVILLSGELGTGKTQFTKGIAQGLNIEKEIISPTFTIERVYQGATNPSVIPATSFVIPANAGIHVDPRNKFEDDRQLEEIPQKVSLHHFDFYRLTSEDLELKEEIEELIKDKNNIIVIEWPENQDGLKFDEYLDVNLKYLKDEEREIEFIPEGDTYQNLLEKIWS